MNNIKISDLELDIKDEDKYVLFISKKTNIYEIDELFTIKKQEKKKI